ncbi:hypothetical protein L2719_09495 [Shewanella schlegeliana]|uniref:Uncharacterized protein n=1 Tax=Shewanella schlegeliana TaxID=190308 RepID=A0ABS1SW24_9GAMM|nr:hypothetical protein [Shewanella schlegeliana]MBL4912713.1 hypothetical protein [Shewanella schlegeliana]MCL1109777.1 hypothetical protein [Shewanella schlegeliana]GIU30340.1 hypothetical protein TUM4433_20710 [Shewanella schlegeliana]
MTSVSGAIGSAVGSAITASVANTPTKVANEAATSATTQAASLPNVGASTNVAISAGAQQKLADEQLAVKAEGSTSKVDAAPEEEGDLESFVFGALGLDHPEEIDENGDPSYSAGQYVKAAATVGGMIAMFI